MQPVLFYLFSALAILSAIAVIAASRPTRALLSLIVTMFALAVLYLLLGAPFVAMAHLIVYAGAVLVLFLFVIMLQGVGAKEISLFKRFGPGQIFFSGLAVAGFFGILVKIAHTLKLAQPAGVQGTVETVGESLFKNYLIPFELTSILLLVGVFAAVSLAKKETA